MKVMISQPMNGKTEEQIRNERKSIIDKLNKMHIEVIDTIFEEEAPENCNIGVFYLAKSIEAMKDVDAVFFTKDRGIARGCRIEREIAKEYGIKILDNDFIEDTVDNIKCIEKSYQVIPV